MCAFEPVFEPIAFLYKMCHILESLSNQTQRHHRIITDPVNQHIKFYYSQYVPLMFNKQQSNDVYQTKTT